MQVHWNQNLEKRLCNMPRSHPWTTSSEDDGARYVDLRANPWLVREVLEDFNRYEDRLATQRFYEILVWVNGADSLLETNDCLLRVGGGPSSAQTVGVEIRGHLTFFFRDLVQNCRPAPVAWLCQQLERSVGSVDPKFSGGAFDYARWPTYFRALQDSSGAPMAGNLINLRFVSHGSDEQDAFVNLDRTFATLQQALQEISCEAQHTIKGAIASS